MSTKLTLTNLTALAKAVIESELIGMGKESFDAFVSRNDFTDLTVKIGKQLMLDSDFTDRLSEFEAEELPFGTTIEEYFIEMLLPESHDPTGATTLAPRNPKFAKAFYSKELARKTLATSVRSTAYKNGMLSADNYAGLVARIIKKHMDSWTLYKYQLKKELIGEMISRVPENDANNTMKTSLAVPNSTATGETWIKQVKKQVTELSMFITDTNNLAGVISKAPSLTLLVKGSDLIPSLDVDTLAGAFNSSKVEIPVKVKQVEDFGDLTGVNKDTWAVLIDPRGIAIHTHDINTEQQRNGQGEFTTHYLHYTPVAFLSHYTSIHIWTKPSS